MFRGCDYQHVGNDLALHVCKKCLAHLADIKLSHVVGAHVLHERTAVAAGELHLRPAGKRNHAGVLNQIIVCSCVQLTVPIVVRGVGLLRAQGNVDKIWRAWRVPGRS